MDYERINWLLVLSNVLWVAFFFTMRRSKQDWRANWEIEHLQHAETKLEMNRVRRELERLKYSAKLPKDKGL